MGKLEEIAELAARLGGQAPQPKYLKMRDAADAVYASERAGWRMAEDLLHLYPEALDRVDEVVGDNQMSLGKYLGSGAESLVWEATPRAGGPAQVLKVRVGEAAPADFTAGHPSNVAGIVPYWGAEQAGHGVAVAFQPMARTVYSRGMYAAPFNTGAERLQQSLLARGVHWSDAHKWNVGAMPDGTWGVIDGWVFPSHPAWSRPSMSNEEAIRMLRLTADEQAALYGAAP